LHRLASFHGGRQGQTIPPLDALEDEVDKRIASGESEQDVTLAVIEDFEKSAATVSARTTPLVPVSGIIVTGAGILARESGEDEVGTVLALLAMLITLVGLAFLAASVFTHAGRPTSVSSRHERMSPSCTIGSSGRSPTRGSAHCSRSPVSSSCSSSFSES
jgi:hypothetical protein